MGSTSEDDRWGRRDTASVPGKWHFVGNPTQTCGVFLHSKNVQGHMMLCDVM